MMCCRGKRDTDIHLHRSKKVTCRAKYMILLFSLCKQGKRGEEEDLLDRDVADDVAKDNLSRSDDSAPRFI